MVLQGRFPARARFIESAEKYRNEEVEVAKGIEAEF